MRDFALPEPAITLEMVLSWRPCYGEDQVRRIWGDVEERTVFDLLELPISVADMLWLLLRPEVLGERMCHELACDFAERALVLLGSPVPQSINAIAIKRAWIVGLVTDQELAAAREAAREAAGWAARAAAGASAREAARWAAGWAARAAARWAARAVQLAMVRERLGVKSA